MRAGEARGANLIGNSVWSSFDVFLQLSKYTVLQLFNLAAGETCHFHFVFHASPLILSPFLFLFSLNLFSLNERPLVAFVLAFRLCFLLLFSFSLPLLLSYFPWLLLATGSN